jgi:hypothetical protein
VLEITRRIIPLPCRQTLSRVPPMDYDGQKQSSL